LKSSDDNITIDGLSGLIRQPTKEDMAALRNYRGDIGQKLKDSHGIDRFLKNKKGFDLLKALYLEPSVSINGLESGCQGELHSTIIPAKATAKLDLRLVPDMSSGKVMRLLRAHLDKKGFADIRLTGSGYDAAKTPVTDPFVELVVQTAKEIAAPAPVNTMPLMPMTGPAYLFEPYTPFCYCTCYADMDKTYAHGANENWPISCMVNSMAFVARIAEQLG
jgi:acetylornithine deacetylase/succinyl-diaminopimelate desuccinylase-like protein